MADKPFAPPSIRSVDFNSYRVHPVRHHTSCRDFLHELKQHCADYPVLGFDCEWWSTCKTDPKGHRRKVALLQLASAGGLCLLIQLIHLSEVPQELRDLLDDSRILKVGVEPHDDGSKLHQDYGLAIQGTLDLQKLARHLKIPAPHGLKALAKSMLGFEMAKKRQVVMSNWEKCQLTADQIDYAAKDAIVGLEVFRAFNERMELREMNLFLDVRYKPPVVPKLQKTPKQPVEQSVEQPVEQPVKQPVEQPVKQPVKQPKRRHPRSNLAPQRLPLPAKRMRVAPWQLQQLQGQLYTEF